MGRPNKFSSLARGTVSSYPSEVSRFEGEDLVTKARLRGSAEGALGPCAAQLERLANGGPPGDREERGR